MPSKFPPVYVGPTRCTWSTAPTIADDDHYGINIVIRVVVDDEIFVKYLQIWPSTRDNEYSSPIAQMLSGQRVVERPLLAAAAAAVIPKVLNGRRDTYSSVNPYVNSN